MQKRTTVLLLLSAMLLTSCQGSNGDTQTSTAVSTDTTTEAVTEKVSALSTIPVIDCNGYEFKIISTNQDNRHIDVVATEENGALLNDLVYKRNRSISEIYNLTISTEDKPYNEINDLIMRSVMTGDNPYDLYMTNSTAISLVTAGYLMPWNEVPGIDITQPWWDQSAISDMSIAGASYLITGDISPTCLLTSECIVFNKNLFDSRGLKYPYDEAFNGTWTIDKMIEMSQGLTEDVNGDGVYDDKVDKFSFTLWMDAGTALFYGSEGYLSKKDAGGLPVLDINLEKATSIYEKIYKLVVGNQANYSKVDHEQTFKVFNQGRAYFCDITFQKIEMFLRDMKDDYGVLPLPKFNESQKSYLTNVSGAGTMIVMPATVENPEQTGIVIDALAAAAYDTITPSLYDIIAGVRNVRDEESAEMVQLIIRNRVYDPVRMYMISGNNFADDLLALKSTDVASYFATNETLAKAELKKLIEAFTENNKQ
jgi:hypothetical protein